MAALTYFRVAMAMTGCLVNRGTQELEDRGIDAVMADQDVNLQWSDALNLAQQAADYAAAA